MFSKYFPKIFPKMFTEFAFFPKTFLRYEIFLGFSQEVSKMWVQENPG